MRYAAIARDVNVVELLEESITTYFKPEWIFVMAECCRFLRRANSSHSATAFRNGTVF